MNEKYFGEGICSLSDRKDSFVRLTWKNNVVDILDLSLQTVFTMKMFDGVKEGWGITRNGTRLYVSNGSENITFVNSNSFETEGRLTVHMPNGQKLNRINELEYVDGSIWANIFMSSFIVKIDAQTGLVTKSVDLNSLLETELEFHRLSNDNRLSFWDDGNNVLNGIAYDAENDEFFVTGKRWSLMFRIKII